MKKHARKVGGFWTSAAVVCAMATGLAQSPAGGASPEGQLSHKQQGRGESIQVHGHWTIDVRNPDGALASHNEFENALEPTGAAALAALLLRAGSLPTWQVELIGASGGPCVQTPSVPSGNASLVMGLVSGGTLTTNPQTNSWTSTGILTPGAPYLLDPGGGGPVTVFQLSALVGDPLSSLMVVQMTSNNFLFSPANGVPGLTTNYSGNIPPDFVFDWNTQGVAPGTYSTTFSLFEDPSGPSNTYQIIATIPAAQSTPPTSVPCTAVEPGTAIGGDLANAWYPTLTLGVNVTNGNVGVELAGSVTVPSADAIDHVRSVLVFANATTRTGFSARALATPIQVVAGQQVFVKVLFTFS